MGSRAVSRAMSLQPDLRSPRMSVAAVEALPLLDLIGRQAAVGVGSPAIRSEGKRWRNLRGPHGRPLILDMSVNFQRLKEHPAAFS